MSEEGWRVLDSSGESGLEVERWNLGWLLEFVRHPSVELHLHTVRRRSDGTTTLAIMIAPADVDFVPAPIAAALDETGAQLIPLAVITGDPVAFSREWEDLGRLPRE